jgi:hypothetical protein
MWRCNRRALERTETKWGLRFCEISRYNGREQFLPRCSPVFRSRGFVERGAMFRDDHHFVRALVLALLIVSAFAAAATASDANDIRLVDAARTQDSKAVRALLNQKVNVNARSSDGSTLAIAARAGSTFECGFPIRHDGDWSLRARSSGDDPAAWYPEEAWNQADPSGACILASSLPRPTRCRRCARREALGKSPSLLTLIVTSRRRRSSWSPSPCRRVR